MEEEKVAAIVTKDIGVDANGLQQYIWATQRQAERLLEMQFDEEMRHFVYMIGDESLRPCDILKVKIMKLEYAKKLPAFNSYVIKELEREAEKEKEKLGPANTEDLKKISEIKSRSKLLN